MAWSLLGLWRRLMLALDPRWLYLDLRLLSSGQRRASASVGAPWTLFLMRGIGTPCFWLVEHVNAFVNESKVGIDFVDFG